MVVCAGDGCCGCVRLLLLRLFVICCCCSWRLGVSFVIADVVAVDSCEFEFV